MSVVYRKIFPYVNKELSYWRERAKSIPNEELRTQALHSIQDKTFHCEGGGIYALLAKKEWKEAIRFIVAYQTISDYLDNLCDRSTSMDPDDFRALHDGMLDALLLERPHTNYYRFREEQDDGGYLNELISTCQSSLRKLETYSLIQPYLRKLASKYCDLQVHKHVVQDERVPRLQQFYEEHEPSWKDLSWYEFSASTGSTLGIFCLVSYAFGHPLNEEKVEGIYRAYFPYMQGLHILLDYYIDQQEDLEEGDLNFCNYYQHEEELKSRFIYFIEKTKSGVARLPYPSFHRMVYKGLVGLYLADSKVSRIEGSPTMVKELLGVSGIRARFFYLNTKLYNRMKTGQ
ncbi:tetraprenyl-beta-curcumene synthase family protein [Pontibacillus halophilus]|nr:tetraprenyl-beta-curcumene synthase family protein [Pontibacillus halophilus]